MNYIKNNLIPIYLYKNINIDDLSYVKYKFFVIDKEKSDYIIAHEKTGICTKINENDFNNCEIVHYNSRINIIHNLKMMIKVADYIHNIEYIKYINNYLDKLYQEELQYRIINSAVKIISKYYLECYYNPNYTFCIKRLKKYIENNHIANNTI